VAGRGDRGALAGAVLAGEEVVSPQLVLMATAQWVMEDNEEDGYGPVRGLRQ